MGTPSSVGASARLGKLDTVGQGFRFDWYEATFDGWQADEVASSLAVALGSSGAVTRCKGQHGYGFGVQLVEAGEVVLTVFGGSERVDEVHVRVSGGDCDAVVPLIRKFWPEHRVSRVDSSVDFVADFEELDAVALDFCRNYHIGNMPKPLSHRLTSCSKGGATRYLGSVKSSKVVRVYKKSEEVRAKDPRAVVPDGVVRVELQLRPSKRAGKAAVASMSPQAVWGLGWPREFAQLVAALDVEPVELEGRNKSEWSRALWYLGQQYGKAVRKRAEEVGVDVAMDEVRRSLCVVADTRPPKVERLELAGFGADPDILLAGGYLGLRLLAQFAVPASDNAVGVNTYALPDAELIEPNKWFVEPGRIELDGFRQAAVNQGFR